MIGRNGERGSGISALAARHDDDDDDDDYSGPEWTWQQWQMKGYSIFPKDATLLFILFSVITGHSLG